MLLVVVQRSCQEEFEIIFKGEITTMLDFIDLRKSENLAKVRNTIYSNSEKLSR